MWPRAPYRRRKASPIWSAPHATSSRWRRCCASSPGDSPTSPERVYVALGSNLGDRAAHLAHARARLNALPGTRVLAVSRAEETAPIGPVAQPPYLNQMVLLETTLTPAALLAHCLAIEAERGRKRGERWGPRTLDLDIVRYGARNVREPNLTIPHPELPNRDFWQRGIAELDGADV